MKNGAMNSPKERAGLLAYPHHYRAEHAIMKEVALNTQDPRNRRDANWEYTYNPVFLRAAWETLKDTGIVRFLDAFRKTGNLDIALGQTNTAQVAREAYLDHRHAVEQDFREDWDDLTVGKVVNSETPRTVGRILAGAIGARTPLDMRRGGPLSTEEEQPSTPHTEPVEA